MTCIKNICDMYKKNKEIFVSLRLLILFLSKKEIKEKKQDINQEERKTEGRKIKQIDSFKF